MLSLWFGGRAEDYESYDYTDDGFDHFYSWTDYTPQEKSRWRAKNVKEYSDFRDKPSSQASVNVCTRCDHVDCFMCFLLDG